MVTYTHVMSLQVRFGQIKKKLGLDTDSPSKATSKNDNGGPSGPVTPTKVTKPRGGGGSGSARGKAKSAGRARSKKAEMELELERDDEEDDDDLDAPLSVKKEELFEDDEVDDGGSIFGCIHVATQR